MKRTPYAYLLALSLVCTLFSVALATQAGTPEIEHPQSPSAGNAAASDAAQKTPTQ